MGSRVRDRQAAASTVGAGFGRVRIPVGISSCLLGERVRYDGNHKHDAYITGTLSRLFELVPFCPEVAAGLGVPRPPIRLVRGGEGTRAVTRDAAGRDVTDALADYGHRVADQAGSLRGFILKRASPSCGMERVKVYAPEGGAPGMGSGIFAAVLKARLPLLPMEEEGRLGDPGLRESFVTRVAVYHAWRGLEEAGLTAAALVGFHSRHKLLLLAHNQAGYRRMGRLVARAGAVPLGPLAETYARELMGALSRRVTRGRHVNVMHHLMGYLKRSLDAGDKAELLEALEAYRTGAAPRAVPLTLLRHHFRRHPHPYVADQVYLRPSPLEALSGASP
jgi:uncharacterized protein YbgA (DUF1722 family)/uncharacterized protein YbbK (DUF523 family)